MTWHVHGQGAFDIKSLAEVKILRRQRPEMSQRPEMRFDNLKIHVLFV